MASSSEHDLDDLEQFEAKATARKLPIGFRLLFWGLILFGAYYLWAYSPSLGGWSQSQDLAGDGAAGASNLVATILFTAIPTAAALGLWLAQRRKKG
jgi:hypothetical protein